jgi:hypothetical protein
VRTEYEFVLPRGYVDEGGSVHRRGVMRLATARDELEPLRDPTILGADDPRLTIVVLSRVVQSLGSLPMVTRHEIEGLFAADLAYLQDFYGVINFGSEEDIEALLDAQEERGAPASPNGAGGAAEPPGAAPAQVANGSEERAGAGSGEERPARAVGRRQAIEEVPSTGR